MLVLLWVWRSPKAKELNLSLRGLIVVYTTQRGKGAMDRVGSYRRFCNGLAVFSKIVSAVLMLLMVFLMLVAAYNIPGVIMGTGSSGVAGTGGFGLNIIHFLIFGVIALIIAMVIHEFAHGVQSRANDVGVEQSGLMYAVVPLGAFVEMNKEDSEKASLKSRMSIYSAGVASNFIVAIIAFFVLAGLMLAPLGNSADVNDDSAGVYSTSSNIDGIPVGSVITHIDDVEVSLVDSGSDKILSVDSLYSNEIVPLTYITENGENTIDFRMGLYIDFVAQDSPAHKANINSNSIITNIQREGVDNEISGIKSFRDFIAGSSPGDEVIISYYNITEEKEIETAEITLSQNGDVGYIGVGVNYSGISFIAPKDVMGTAMNPIYGQTTLTGGILSMISYPFISLSGFSPMPEAFQWWFDAPGGEIFWLLAAFIYWMFWVNFLLGVTNALPALPFDGGFLFKGWVTQLLDKINYKDQETREKIADNVTSAVSGFMLFLLALIIFVVILY